ncbi:MAG: ComEC/Rec2 family competence protein [Imperialibacter sp.]|uniref:ComEC/Rec2 family competence protein n=1 Tax=Imperialibacter sp. TaxID=2038411 RepID=UPI0032EEE4A4
MIRWSAIPFVRIFIACAAGIGCHELFLRGTWLPSSYIGLVWLVVLLLWFYSRKNAARSLRYLFGIVFMLSIGLVGILRRQSTEAIFQENHLYTSKTPIDFYKGILVDDPAEKTNTWAFDVQVTAIRSGDSLLRKTGLVQVYLKKDSATTANLSALKYGTVLWIHGSPEEIRPLRNPGGFDFKQYMARKGIHFQDYVTFNDVLLAGSDPPNRLVSVSMGWRRELLHVLKEYLPDVWERGIAEALILGQKDEIDIEQRRAYAAAGAMHILAVSGLHVGIIYMILAFLLKPLEKRKYGKLVRFVVLFACLWGFALITGMSASVLRAVTMFSIVMVAEGLGRKTNIYNSLALAAFLLLLYDPNFLFHVGYQLSFLAVLGIVYLQPFLYRQWAAPHWLLDKTWAITCVSLAAQLATGPLSMYYFNQFPSWFLLSNLLVIPAAFLILSTGVALFAVHYVSSFLAGTVAFMLKWMVFGLNWFVEFIEQLPASQIFPISFSSAQTWLLYGALLLMLFWWQSRDYRWFQYMAACLLLFVLSKGLFVADKHQKRELVIYEMTGYTAMDYQEGGKVFHYFDEAFKQEERLFNLNVRPHLIQQGTMIPFVSHADNWLPQTVLIEDTLVAIKAGSLKVFHLLNPLPKRKAFSEPLAADLLIVSNQSFWPTDLGKYFAPEEIVFDGTSRFNYLSRTSKALQTASVKVYVIPWEGAYVRDLREREL